MKKYFFFFVIILLVACSNNNPSLKQFQWFANKWVGGNDSLVLKEEWQYNSDTLMNGIGLAIFKGDTVFSEKIKLLVRNKDIIYQVTGAENNDIVDFKFLQTKNDTFIFENLQHDFPQRILYFKNGEDSLYARIEGKDNGLPRKELFVFGKAK